VDRWCAPLPGLKQERDACYVGQATVYSQLVLVFALPMYESHDEPPCLRLESGHRGPHI
jgi:hypothetical protein